MLHEFMTWWGAQLASLLPASLSGRAGRRDGVGLALSPGMDAVEVRLRGAGPVRSFPLTPTGAAALRALLGPRPPAAIELVLPPGRLLEQTVSLPLAAERDPARVLGYEMDRLTPFAADALYWSWRVQGRDRAAGLLTLVLSLTPRAALRPVIEVLAGAGLRPGLLRAGTSVIHLEQDAGRGWQRHLRLGLAAACAVLALGVVAAPFIRQEQAGRAIDRQIAEARPAVERIEALRRRALSAAAGVDVLAAQRAESGSVLAMLAALTNALPDDTSLSDLVYRARVATVSGQSGAAVRLIPALTAEQALRNTAFTAPVTRNEARRTEGFSLRTELAP